MTFVKRLAAIALMTSVAVPAVGQDSRDFRLGPASPPPHPAYSHLYLPFQERLPAESDGRLTGTIYGMDVAGLREMQGALSSGLIEIGLLLQSYFPSDFPEASLTADLALQGRNPHVMAAAVTEYIVTCAPCQEEMKRFGGVFLGSGSSDVYVLISSRPLSRVEDIAGQRLRVSTSTFGRLAEAMGAVPVSIASNDTFEAMSQGTLDGSMASVGDLVTQRLIDVARYVTEVPLGTFHTTSGFTVNAGVWQDLSVEDREAMARAAVHGNVAFTQRWGYDLADMTRQMGSEAGIEFVEPSDELIAFVNDFAANDVAAAAMAAEEQYGIEDAAAKLASMETLVTKWEDLLADAEDPAAIEALIQSEIWSKVDFATYGL
ncbi:MAG: C4-dicarboxylate TRAP transporter substrate-binding protein [Hyphomonas sp.]